LKATARGLAVVVAVALCASCAHRRNPHAAPPLPETILRSLAGATQVYTLTNLHPDDERMVLYTANFQQPGFIPICSEVTLLDGSSDWMTFKVNATGKEYEYDPHPASAEPFDTNLERYFGAACPTAKLEALTPEERDAVRRGLVVPGMRKEAVVLAIGYPPKRDTPSLDKTMWTYWYSRMRSFMVEFDASGKVVTIYN
jgi:hypothetical protein